MIVNRIELGMLGHGRDLQRPVSEPHDPNIIAASLAPPVGNPVVEGFPNPIDFPPPIDGTMAENNHNLAGDRQATLGHAVLEAEMDGTDTGAYDPFAAGHRQLANTVIVNNFGPGRVGDLEVSDRMRDGRQASTREVMRVLRATPALNSRTVTTAGILMRPRDTTDLTRSYAERIERARTACQDEGLDIHEVIAPLSATLDQLADEENANALSSGELVVFEYKGLELALSTARQGRNLINHTSQIDPDFTTAIGPLIVSRPMESAGRTGGKRHDRKRMLTTTHVALDAAERFALFDDTLIDPYVRHKVFWKIEKVFGPLGTVAAGANSAE